MKHRLLEAMENHGDSRVNLSDYLGITYQTLSKKLNGHFEFTLAELKAIKDRYKLSDSEFCQIFFAN